MQPLISTIKSRPQKLLCCDLRVQYPDGDQTDSVLAARTLQGLINRSDSEKLYLYNDCTDVTHNIGGAEWEVQRAWQQEAPELLALPYSVIPRKEGTNGGLHALLAIYAKRLRGIVIWDENPHGQVKMATSAAAVTLCSQKEALPVSPVLAKQIHDWGFDFPIVADLRKYRFSSDHEVMMWSVSTLLSGANQCIGMVFSLGLDGWAPQDVWGDQWWSHHVLHEGPVDYAVTVNGFCFNLNVSDGNDEEALLTLLRHYVEGRTAILGWIPTHPFLYGFSEVPTCLNRTSYYVMGVNGFSNMSVLASYPLAVPYQPTYRAYPVKENGVYISFVATDGDALHCVYRGMFAAFNKNKDNSFGKTPITWTMNPILAELCPPVFSYFVNHLPPESDMAFAWADKIQTVYDTGAETLAGSMAEYAQKSGLLNVWTVNSGEECQHAEICHWNAIVVGYGDSRLPAGISKTRQETMVFGIWDFGEKAPENLVKEIQKLADGSQGPQFFTVLLGACFDNASMFYQLAGKTEALLQSSNSKKEFSCLSLGDLTETYRAYIESGVCFEKA